ncbi:hypothetical protein NDN08_001764 [Rhodosorus marinus]|uniref:MEKHLA domain-containing protein n=1 Tax=Rhodosorus marinus TaxID=101924 RepID=A0AAV8URT9_9RHOD|nr:hypothetical protein NDN08_001764 [Rhodosorus marinus]
MGKAGDVDVDVDIAFIGLNLPKKSGSRSCRRVRESTCARMEGMTEEGTLSTNNKLKLARSILDSYSFSCKEELIPPEDLTSEKQAAAMLFNHPYIIMAHDRFESESGYENGFTYANKTTLDSFDLTFDQFVHLLSNTSTTADDDAQAERNQILRKTLLLGPTQLSNAPRQINGKDFLIEDGTLFNLADSKGIYAGQCVVIRSFSFPPS